MPTELCRKNSNTAADQEASVRCSNQFNDGSLIHVRDCGAVYADHEHTGGEAASISPC